MARLLYQLEGVRGRTIWIFDRKCVIATQAGVGSFLTGNVSDGQKTIFYTDVVGLQFKKSGGLIGYLQFETGSVQMNNQSSNMFSENTFTFEHGKNGITNDQMEHIYHQLCDILEAIKYGDVTSPALNAPAPGYAPAPGFAPAPQGNPMGLPPTPGKRCPACGMEMPADMNFCRNCGTPLK